VRGAGSPRKWDEQAGYGSDGASLKWTGDGLSEFTVTFQAWDETIFIAWDTFREIVKKSPPNVQPKVLDIRHPTLEELDIHAVVVLDVSQWDVADDTGMWEKEVKLKVYRAPRPALASPKASIDKPDNPDDAQDAADLLTTGLSRRRSGRKDRCCLARSNRVATDDGHGRARRDAPGPHVLGGDADAT